MLVIKHNKRCTVAAGKAALKEKADGMQTVVKGNKLPSLRALLKWLPKKFLLILEIRDPRSVPELIDVLKGNKKHVVVTSLWHTSVYKVSKACDVDCGIIMPIRPIYLKPFLQLLPIRMKYIMWDHQVYNPSFKEELDSLKHIVYNTGKLYEPEADGIISTCVKCHRTLHTEHLEDRRRKVRTKKVYG